MQYLLNQKNSIVYRQMGFESNVYYIHGNLSNNNRINISYLRRSASAILCAKIKRTKKTVRGTVVGGRIRYRGRDRYVRKRRKNRIYAVSGGLARRARGKYPPGPVKIVKFGLVVQQ
jgi:hypothetical protein